MHFYAISNNSIVNVATRGVEVHPLKFSTNLGPIQFNVWDTAGQERYRSLAPMYYRGAKAAVVVYDVTSRSSFDGAQSWVRELLRRGDPEVG